MHAHTKPLRGQITLRGYIWGQKAVTCHILFELGCGLPQGLEPQPQKAGSGDIAHSLPKACFLCAVIQRRLWVQEHGPVSQHLD